MGVGKTRTDEGGDDLTEIKKLEIDKLFNAWIDKTSKKTVELFSEIHAFEKTIDANDASKKHFIPADIRIKYKILFESLNTHLHITDSLISKVGINKYLNEII